MRGTDSLDQPATKWVVRNSQQKDPEHHTGPGFKGRVPILLESDGVNGNATNRSKKVPKEKNPKSASEPGIIPAAVPPYIE